MDASAAKDAVHFSRLSGVQVGVDAFDTGGIGDPRCSILVADPCRFPSDPLEEIAQLRVADIKSEGGIWYFDIALGAGDGKAMPAKKLKSKAAPRRIQIHAIVLEAGFVKHVESARKSGKVLVFSDRVARGVADRYGYTFSKWFGRYTKDTGINGDKTKGVVFHSFRHTAISAMKWAGVHPDIMDELEGHAGQGERKRYSKQSPIPVLKQAIEAIQYEGITADLFRSD